MLILGHVDPSRLLIRIKLELDQVDCAESGFIILEILYYLVLSETVYTPATNERTYESSAATFFVSVTRWRKGCFKPDRQSRHSISGSSASVELPACNDPSWLFDSWKDVFTCYALSWTACEEQSDSAVRWPWSLQQRSSPKKIYPWSVLNKSFFHFWWMITSFVSFNWSSLRYDAPQEKFHSAQQHKSRLNSINAIDVTSHQRVTPENGIR